MSESKFRAWAFDDEFMVDESYDGDEFIFAMDNCKPKLLEAKFDQINQVVTGYVECNHEMLQYTGLIDKNGVEICEGDILALDNEVERGGYHIYKIEYDNCKGRFIGNDGGEISCMPSIVNHHDGAGRYMVIGNVYENPELLKSPD